MDSGLRRFNVSSSRWSRCDWMAWMMRWTSCWKGSLSLEDADELLL